MSEKITIKLVASDNLDAFYNYTNAYKNIVAEFGKNYGGFSENWYQRPNTYACIISNENEEIISGYWLQIHQPDFDLPILNKKTKYDAKIKEFITDQKHYKLCEFGGFFVRSDYRKTLISREAMRSALVYGVLLDLDTVISISLDKTLQILNSLQLYETRNIMGTDDYFLYANNPKSFVFEIHNFAQQVKEQLNYNEDTLITKKILEEKDFSYCLSNSSNQYQFSFNTLINEPVMSL